jgi:hypothetical protein
VLAACSSGRVIEWGSPWENRYIEGFDADHRKLVTPLQHAADELD